MNSNLSVIIPPIKRSPLNVLSMDVMEDNIHSVSVQSLVVIVIVDVKPI